MKDSCPRVWFHPSRSIRRGRDRLIDRPSQGEEQEEEEEEEEEENGGRADGPSESVLKEKGKKKKITFRGARHYALDTPGELPNHLGRNEEKKNNNPQKIPQIKSRLEKETKDNSEKPKRRFNEWKYFFKKYH